MVSREVRTFLEVGPGRVLLGMMKRMNGGMCLSNVEDTESLKKTKSIVEGAG